MSETRVLVVDDHAIVRKGICALLRAEDDMQVVGETRTGDEAIREAERLKPDVVLMDLAMPVMDGEEAIRAISATVPSARILVVTSFATDDRIFAAIRAGASGYLLKDSGPSELVSAIRHVRRGESWVDPAVAGKLLSEFRQSGEHAERGPSSSDELTERELEVLQLIAAGHSNKEIAGRLFISEATVQTHVSNILSKLHVKNRGQATVYALRHGLARLED